MGGILNMGQLHQKYTCRKKFPRNSPQIPFRNDPPAAPRPVRDPKGARDSRGLNVEALRGLLCELSALQAFSALEQLRMEMAEHRPGSEGNRRKIMIFDPK